MKRKKVVVAIIVIAVIAVLVWRNFGSPSNEEPPRRAYGNIDIREVNLAFRVSGRVESVLVEEGDSVAPGQLLAKLDAAPYHALLAGAQAKLAQAEANLAKMQTGYRDEEIEQARATVAVRQASLKQAERNLNRQRQLSVSRVSAEEALENAETNFEVAQAQLAVAQASLNLINSGFRKEDVEQAKAEVERAKANLQQIELQISDTSLKSPSAGVVITRALEPGAIAAVGQSALTLSLKDRVWARAYLPEPQLGNIHPGMAVQVHTDSSETPYHGQIGFISPRAEFTPKSVETTELRSSLIYRFRVIITDPDDGLRQGMPITVTW